MYTFIEIALSLIVLVVLITALSVCVCGCKNSNQKSELVGTAGVVKIRLDEEVPSPTPTTPASIKRASTQNSQRSLPEIPHPVGRHDSGDTASEIYATVNLDEGNKAAATTSVARPYEHEYAKLQNDSHNVTVEITPDESSEVGNQIDEREAVPSAAESVLIPASVAISGQLASSAELPYITPPSPRPAPDPVHFSGDSTDSAKGYTSISVREPLSNIRAQSGRARATHYATVSDDSDEMYAAIEEASVGEGSDTYAQIAPEPRRRDAPAHAPHASHVLHAEVTHHARRSAPPEIGASTSNSNHSRQASMSSCSNSTGALGSPKPEKRQANSPLPPPPQATTHAHASHTSHTSHASHTSHTSHASHAPHSSHTTHATHTASNSGTHTSYAASHAQNTQRHHRMSSTGDLHFNHDKLRRSLNEKHQRNNSCVSSSDFYGCNYPVEKHRFSSGDLIRPLVAKELNFDIDQKDAADNLYNSIDGPQSYSDYSSAEPPTSLTSEHRSSESPSRNVEEMYAKVMKKVRAKEEARKSRDVSDAPATLKLRGDDPGYETIDRKQTSNHGYETIARKDRKPSDRDPGYETVKEVNKTQNMTNNNLLKLNNLADSGPDSIISSDAGYEKIAKADNNASDSDPNYEVLRNEPPTPPYATIAPDYNIQPTYSVVNKRFGKPSWPTNNNDEATDPNYESMSNDPLYTTGSESDPNYESVRPKDPNYESVNNQDPNYESLRCKDPKYESVRSKDSKYDSVRSKKDPNYESVKYFELSRKEPPYEKVNNDMGGSGVDRSDSSAGYEKINVPSGPDARSSINNGADATVSDYFQV